MNELLGVELFAVGVWNGRRFTIEDLRSIAQTYTRFATVLQIPLKFGHNSEQPMTDGQPAIGWVTNVRVVNQKLVGDFINLPDIVFNAIEQQLYGQVSIELDIDVTYKNNEYPFVLTGVALLGADLPAVNTLQDLHKFLPSKTGADVIKAARHFSFTVSKRSFSMDELEKLKAKFAALEAQFTVLKEASDALTVANATLTTEKAELTAKVTKSEDDAKAAEFKTAKEGVVKSFDILVKATKITPAQREAFTAGIKDNDLATVEAAKTIAATLSEGLDVAKFTKEGAEMTASDDKGDLKNEGKPADIVLLSKVRELRATKDGASLSFSAARERVFAAEPDLAEDYKTLTAEV